jgi:flagellar biosynthesis protein FlhB
MNIERKQIIPKREIFKNEITINIPRWLITLLLNFLSSFQNFASDCIKSLKTLIHIKVKKIINKENINNIIAMIFLNLYVSKYLVLILFISLAFACFLY